VFKNLFSDQPRSSTANYLKYVFKIIILPFVVLVRFYQIVLSPLCQQPADLRTCSSYMIEALQTHGLLYGGFLGLKRILSCHPWAGGI
jgi:putative membrane protein insertion efficiency factor